MGALSATISPTVDRSASKEASKDLQDDLAAAEEISPDIDTSGAEDFANAYQNELGSAIGNVEWDDFQSGDSFVQDINPQTGMVGDPIETSRMLQNTLGETLEGGALDRAERGRDLGQAAADRAGGGGIAQAAGGAAGAVGLAALGGIAASVATLAKASPKFGKILGMLTDMFFLALRPLGDIAAEALLPFAMAGMEMAMKFNQMVNEDGLAVALGSVVVGAIKAIPEWLAQIQGFIWSLPFRIWEMAFGVLGSIFESVGLHGLADLMYDASETTGEMVDLIQSLPYETWQFMKQIPGHILTGLETIMDSIPGLEDIPGGSTVSNIAGSIPGLASGGIVTGPTTALVGEGTESEAVMPLSKLENMVSFEKDLNVEVETEVTLDDSELVDLFSEAVRILKEIRDQDPVEVVENERASRTKSLH